MWKDVAKPILSTLFFPIVFGSFPNTDGRCSPILQTWTRSPGIDTAEQQLLINSIANKNNWSS